LKIKLIWCGTDVRWITEPFAAMVEPLIPMFLLRVRAYGAVPVREPVHELTRFSV